MIDKPDLMLTVNQIVKLNNKIKEYLDDIDKMSRYVHSCSKYGIKFDGSSNSYYVLLEEDDINCLNNLRKQKIKN